MSKRKTMLKLKLLIIEKGTTQESLADELGVHRVTVSNWCRGYTKPKQGMINAIAQALNVEPKDLQDENKSN